MKTKQLLTVLTAAIFAIAISSCKKTNNGASADEVETTFELSSDQAVADNLTQDDNDVVVEATTSADLAGTSPATPPGGPGGPVITGNFLGGCAVVTVTGNFPAKNIQIDFGTGCTSPWGVVRKGIINIVLTDSLRKTGSTATVTFNNYYVNGFKKEGTIIWTNTTVSGSGTPSFRRQVQNGKITAPSGAYWLHTADISITQTAGASTPNNLTDDVFSISGTRTVTNPAGKTRTSTTQSPLQKKAICANVDQGVVRVEGPNHYAIIDFGNGTCDNLATISIDGRTPRTIILR
ncbi:MAG: hypothetical protein U0V75_10565 [Ferruginibacter sp.]